MEILSQVFIYLLFAVIVIPISKRLGFGSVLGYLIAGILIGPILHLVGNEVGSVQHFAEFGIVIMMFLIGLELKPSMLWALRGQLIGLGGLQIVLSTIALAAIAISMGFSWNEAIAIGMILSLSSTAIILQTLRENGYLKTTAGQSIFSVLLSQDIAVIPILAILPLLALQSSIPETNTSLIEGMPHWLHALLVVACIILIILSGRYLLRPIFRYIAQTKLMEIFTAFALVLVIGIALLMESLGVSPALGAFVAGVVLSDSEYRHEVESQILPFKGLLMGVFFISIGAGINFNLFFENYQEIALWVAFLMISKCVVLMFLAYIFKLKKADFWLFSLSLSQAGEFAFVLFSFVGGLYILTAATISLMTLVVIISMILTPILFVLLEKVIMPLFAQEDQKQADLINHKSHVIVAGVGRFGQVITRILNANKFNPIVLDHDAQTIEAFRKFNNRVYYGNALIPGVLASAGLADARLFVAAIDDREGQITLVQLVKRHLPNLPVIARARDRHHVYELEQAGADFVIRELFESSILAAEKALIFLGESEKKAKRKIRLFKKNDIEMLQSLKQSWLDNGVDAAYVNKATENFATLTTIMQTELHEQSKEYDDKNTS